MSVTIAVPATSANLGIGYDCLGMAVSLYSRFTFDRRGRADHHRLPREIPQRGQPRLSFVRPCARALGGRTLPYRHRHRHEHSRVARPGVFFHLHRRRHHGRRRFDGAHRRASRSGEHSNPDGRPSRQRGARHHGLARLLLHARRRAAPLHPLRREPASEIHHHHPALRGQDRKRPKNRPERSFPFHRRVANGPHLGPYARARKRRCRADRRRLRRQTAGTVSQDAHPRLRGRPPHLPRRRRMHHVDFGYSDRP